MSQVDSIEQAVEKKPQEKHLSDYRASYFTVSTLDLEFDLYDNNTQVKATSVMHRVNDDNEPLFLFGEQLKLISVMVDDLEYSDHQFVEGGLLINNLPNDFKLQIIPRSIRKAIKRLKVYINPVMLFVRSVKRKVFAVLPIIWTNQI